MGICGSDIEVSLEYESNGLNASISAGDGSPLVGIHAAFLCLAVFLELDRDAAFFFVVDDEAFEFLRLA